MIESVKSWKLGLVRIQILEIMLSTDISLSFLLPQSRKQISHLTLLLQSGASLVAQLVKKLPAMQETWVGSLDWEDALEKGRATHSSILAWRIPMVR